MPVKTGLEASPKLILRIEKPERTGAFDGSHVETAAWINYTLHKMLSGSAAALHWLGFLCLYRLQRPWIRGAKAS
jgi:hypothetical protein